MSLRSCCLSGPGVSQAPVCQVVVFALEESGGPGVRWDGAAVDSWHSAAEWLGCVCAAPLCAAAAAPPVRAEVGEDFFSGGVQLFFSSLSLFFLFL